MSAALFLLSFFLIFPAHPDPQKRYLFYMHGKWLETHGLDRPHPEFGFYEYPKIIRALSSKGYEVVSELRLRETSIPEYARQVADQVKKLLDRGVPTPSITVAGHSKGGQMTLIVASLIQEEKVNYVVLAGCGKKGVEFREGYQKFLEQNASRLRGRILSLYDAADRVAGTCQEAFDQGDVKSKEIVFHTGRGHGLFFSPDPRWIVPLVQWTEGN